MSVRTDIRKQVLAVLSATFPGNPVYDSRMEIIPEISLPAVVVFATDETTAQDEGYMGTPVYRRLLTIRVEFNGAAADGRTVTDTLEDMLDQAETALYADALLDSATFDFWLQTVDVSMSADAGQTLMQLGANFAAEYERGS